MPSVNPYPKISTLPSRHVSSNEIHANTEAQAMSMFRASPWVSYDPTANQHDMDDVDMDAPQISTLREEETPPPQKSKASTSRRGKSTKQPKTTTVWVKPPKKELHTEEEYDEAEEEEDQLIDDDDDEMMKPLPPAALPSARSADATPKRKAVKRKPRKSDKRIAEEGKKSLGKDMSRTTGPNTGASMTWFPATPSENPEEGDTASVKESIPPKPASPKKARKAPSASANPRPKKLSLKLKTAVPILADDVGILSEGHTATAASSPHFDDNSSDVELGEPVVPVVEETSLEGVPLPQYPLPTKPFPVQLPPKIATGFAPVIPLDKSGKKVRHWRTAHREIRGIAGGRWFARSWVGEKESEFAAAVAAAAQAKGGDIVVLPKLSGVSISAPVRGSKGKASKAASSLAASAAPSRDGSSVPDIPVTSTRPPTKLRTILAPPSDAGDSDMTGIAGS